LPTRRQNQDFLAGARGRGAQRAQRVRLARAGGRAQRLHQPGRGPDRGDRARLICGELLDVGVAHIEAAGVVAVVDQVQDLFFLLDDGALDDRPSE
jgi:hypothetical protein